MATTTEAHKLLLDGEWIETGESVEVRSPYSGDVVGRVAKAGADETPRAVDAADDLRRGRKADQDRWCRGVARRLDLHVRSRRGSQARRRCRPDGRLGG